MGTDKIEKRLPEEILSYIDEEAVQSGITRQEAVSKLVHAVLPTGMITRPCSSGRK
jgi:myosin heavy subunit